MNFNPHPSHLLCILTFASWFNKKNMSRIFIQARNMNTCTMMKWEAKKYYNDVDVLLSCLHSNIFSTSYMLKYTYFSIHSVHDIYCSVFFSIKLGIISPDDALFIYFHKLRETFFLCFYNVDFFDVFETWKGENWSHRCAFRWNNIFSNWIVKCAFGMNENIGSLMRILDKIW